MTLPEVAAARMPSLRRMPVSFFAVRFCEDLFGLAALVLSVFLAATGRASLLGDWTLWVLSAFVVLRLIDPVHSWFTLRFGHDDEGIWVSRGILHRSVQHLRWQTVAASQTDRTFVQRLFGTASMALRQNGDETSGVVVPDLEMALVARLSAMAGSSPRTPAVVATPRPIHRASIPDLLLASALSGRFVTAGVLALLALAEGLDTVGLLDDLATSSVSPQIWGSLPTAVALGVGAAAVVLIMGALSTAVRFAGLETFIDDDAVVLRHGLLSTRERTIPLAALVGVEVRRNPWEAALGRVRVSLVSVDSSQRLGTNLVLPSLRDEVARTLLAHTPLSRGVGAALEPEARRRALLWGVWGTILTLLVAGAAAAGLVTAGARPLVVVFVCVALLAGVHALGSALSGRLAHHQDAAAVSVSTMFVSHRHRALATSAVHLLSTFGLPRRTGLVQLHYYSGRSRRLVAARYSPSDLLSVAQAVQTIPIPTE